MTDHTASPWPDSLAQIDVWDQTLEVWRDRLAQLGPQLAPADAQRFGRIWTQLRQAFDSVCLQDGHLPPDLSLRLDSLPPLKSLDENELTLLDELLQLADRRLAKRAEDCLGRVAQLEEILALDDNPKKMKKAIERMRDSEAMEASEVTTLYQTFAATHAQLPDRLFERFEASQALREQALRQEKDIEKLRQQKQQMTSWLESEHRRQKQIALVPPPSPEALATLPEPDLQAALGGLLIGRQALESARAYLESILDGEVKK